MENGKRPENTLEMLQEITDVLYDCTKELVAMTNKSLSAHDQIRRNCETLMQLYQEFR